LALQTLAFQRAVDRTQQARNRHEGELGVARVLRSFHKSDSGTEKKSRFPYYTAYCLQAVHFASVLPSFRTARGCAPHRGCVQRFSEVAAFTENLKS
jgi:hypothetical protein